MNQRARNPVRNGTKPTQQAVLTRPIPSQQPRPPWSLLLRSGRGRGGRAPSMSPPPHRLPPSGWRLEVRAPFLPARLGPGLHRRPRHGFLGTGAEAAPLTLACLCVPERRSQLGREAAGSPGSTANSRAPPSGLPAPSAAPPADGAPGLTSPGKRKRRETQRRRGPARRPRGRWVCPPAGKAASPSLRRARGSSHLRKAPGRHHGSPDAVTARGLCCAAA